MSDPQRAVSGVKRILAILACSAAWYLIGCPGAFLASEVVKYFLGLTFGTLAPWIFDIYHTIRDYLTDPIWLLMGAATSAASLAYFGFTHRAPSKPLRTIVFPVMVCSGFGLVSFHYRLLALASLILAITINSRYVRGKIGLRAVVAGWLSVLLFAFIPVDVTFLNMDGPPHFINGTTLTDVGDPFARWLWVW